MNWSDWSIRLLARCTIAISMIFRRSQIGTSPLNPSAENIAVHFANSLKLPNVVRLSKVEVWETANCSAVYSI